MKRDQKRPELIGTRKLSMRSLRNAVNAAQRLIPAADGGPIGGKYDPATDWLYDGIQGKEKWPAVRDLARELERRVIHHQMGQVYELAKRHLGKAAAAKLARRWNYIEED